MSYDILKGSTAKPLPFLMVQSSDHITGLTGATCTVTISKNGGAFASPSGAVSEIANGWYAVAGNATDSGTAGPILLHATATSGDPTDIVVANVIDPAVAIYGANIVNLLGTAWLTPGTAGTPDVNAKLINGVSTSSVTTINANQGTTQPLNFTGTAGSALVKGDAIDWASGAIPAPNVTGVPLVDLKYTLGTLSPAAAGSVGIDWAQVANKTATVALTATTINTGAIATGVWQDTTAGDFTTSGSIGKSLFTSGVVPGASGGLFIAGTNAATTITGSLTTTFTGNLTGSVASVTAAVTVTGVPDVNVKTIDDQTATAAGSVTFPGSIASPTNITGGTITTVTNLTNAPTAGDLTSTMKASVGLAVVQYAFPASFGSYTLGQMIAITAANVVGKTTGFGSSPCKFYAFDGTTQIQSSTTDGVGNRGVATLTPPTI